MDGILAWFAKNGVAANLLMCLVIAGGLSSVSGSIHTQLMPNIDYELVTVSVPYPGASPEEVDETVCVRIAEKLRGLKVIRRVHTMATEGLCHARAMLVPGTEAREALDAVKAQIDTIDSFPADVEEPLVQEFDPPTLALGVVLSGSADERTLARLGDRLREEITGLPGVSVATLEGARPYEVSVEVSEEALRRYGLTLSHVAEAVRRSSLDLPGGSVRTKSSEILLRTRGQAHSREDFESLPLLNGEDGARLTLKDVAVISDGFDETVSSLRFDGQPAVLINVYRVGGQDYENVARQVKSYLTMAQKRLPEGLEVSIWSDVTVFLRSRLATMLHNGRDGLILVLLVLALFLRLRLAMWVALGIPVSLLGALWWMPSLGHSINVVSLVGFIVVLGILVDDAIVVSENVYRHHQRGLRGAQAAVAGVREVAGPVVFSTLTTVAAFLPMTGLPGPVGQQLAAVPIVVILCLGFSLVESLLVLPAHLTNLPDPKALPGRFSWARIQVPLSTLFDYLARVYRPALDRVLSWRYAALAAALALLLVSLGLVAGGRLRFFFFLPLEADVLTVGLTLPQGTPEEVTAEALRHVERSVEELRSQLGAEGSAGILRHVLTQVGSLPGGGIEFADPGRLAASGSHLGGITLELAEGEARSVSTVEVGRRLRQLVGPIPDAVELSYSTSLHAAGRAVDVELAGLDLEDLQRAAAELKSVLGRYPGVYDIRDTLPAGKPELRLSVTPEAETLGIGLAELSRQVRQAFHGEELQRFQRGRNEIKVMVRYPDSQRRLLASLQEMRIRTAGGDGVPFSAAGRAHLGRSFASIERTDGARTVRVSADLDRTQGDSNEIAAELRESVLPGLAATHAGLSYSLVGEQQEQREVVGLLLRNTLLALLAIYGLLALASRSYLQPILIMGAIPFGMIGAIWGHRIMGLPLTIWSVVGMVALGGVVVNDGLILVDFIDRARRTGSPLAEAIHRAGRARLRPVVLTSLTTFAGLAPLVFGKGIQARFLIPLGISLGFGVVFASLISLFLVPVGYSLLSDATSALGRLRPPRSV